MGELCGCPSTSIKADITAFKKAIKEATAAVRRFSQAEKRQRKKLRKR